MSVLFNSIEERRHIFKGIAMVKFNAQTKCAFGHVQRFHTFGNVIVEL